MDTDWKSKSNITKIPCVTCITYAICRAQLKPGNAYSNFLNIIAPKCSIIREYAIAGWDTPEFDYSPSLIDRVMHVLTHNMEYDHDPMH